MSLAEDLNTIIYDMDTINRIQMSLPNINAENSVPVNFSSIWNKTSEIRKIMISFLEKQIIETDNILHESEYKILIDYYKSTQDINDKVVKELLMQAKKNKFKNLQFINENILSEDYLTKLIKN